METSGLKLNNITFTSERELTIDEIVAEGDTMYKLVSAETKKGTAACQIHTLVSRAHPQFSKSYPLVVRYMCDLKQYSSRALRLWLTSVKAAPWKTETEYIESQADYVYKLVCVKNPRASTTDKLAVKSNLRQLLMREHNDFKENAANAEKTVTAHEDKLNDRNLDELYAFMKLLNTEDGIASIGTYRVETDLDTTPRKTIAEIASVNAYNNESNPEIKSRELFSL